MIRAASQVAHLSASKGEKPAADFSVIDPYRMMRTAGSAEKSTRPAMFAWRARVSISATRCRLPNREDSRTATSATRTTAEVTILVNVEPKRIEPLLSAVQRRHDTMVGMD
jgi:hypothetical protein